MNNSLEEIMVDVIRKMDWKPGLTDLEKELLTLELMYKAKLKAYTLFMNELHAEAQKGTTTFPNRKALDKKIFGLSRKELLELLPAFLHKYAAVQ